MSLQYSDLLLLPARHKFLPPSLVKAFTDTCDRLAKAYVSAPSEASLLHILALPKIGLAFVPKSSGSSVVKRLSQYPAIDSPKQRPIIATEQDLGTKVTHLVEHGRLTTAARVLRNDDPPISTSKEVVDQLRDLHPDGTYRPFSVHGSGRGCPPAKDVNSELLDSTVRSLRSHTAAGLSGWSVPLLRLAYRSENFQAFMLLLTNQILQGTAPGVKMLTASRLMALPKANGSIRPIAIGELFYRLATKTVVRHVATPDALLPNQFGVGSKGGVEPPIELVRMAMAGLLPRHYTHLTIMDAVNAFNTMSRRTIANAVMEYLPSLFRAARWAYASPSHLYVVGEPPPDDDPTIPRYLSLAALLHSAQGVRQGDPLSALLFSLGLRPFLQALIDELGEDALVVAYLDDIFILSSDPNMLDRVLTAAHSLKCPVTFNPAKCKTVALDTIDRDGLEMLGTCLGGVAARQTFLEGKIERATEVLGRLGRVSSQVGLLLLRCCLQHDLRHLLRSLDSDGLKPTWVRLHNAMHKQIVRIRGLATPGGDGAQLRALIDFLPTRLGGLGLAPFPLIAQAAFAVAVDDAKARLAPLLGNPADDAPPRVSQRDACMSIYAKLRSSMLQYMSNFERMLHAEAASPLGRTWLNVVPTTPHHILSDVEVRHALVMRACIVTTGGSCNLCGKPYGPMHHERCQGLVGSRVTRHNRVMAAIASALATAKGVTVEKEPPIEGSPSLRNDIRVIALGSAALTDMDIDITVRSFAPLLNKPDDLARHDPSSAARSSQSEASVDAAKAMLDDCVALWREEKANKVRGVVGYDRHPLFLSLPISSGGYCDPEGAAFFAMCKRALGPIVSSMMLKSISLALVKHRALGARIG